MRNHWTELIAIPALIFVLVPVAPLFATQFRMEVEWPTGEVRLGETVELAIRLEHPDDGGSVEVQTPSFPGFELLDVLPGVEEQRDGRRYRRDVYRLLPGSAGTFEIVIPGARFHSADGRIEFLEAQRCELWVREVPDWEIDAIDIRDIRPPVSLASLPPARSLILRALILALLTSLLFLFWRRRRIPPAAGPPPPPPVDALREFEESYARLLGSGLLQRGEDKEFVLRLSMIFREYLGRAFAVPAPDMTSEELLAWTPREAALAPEETQLLQLFDDGDAVKFAGASVPRDILEELAGQTRGLVRRVEGRRGR